MARHVIGGIVGSVALAASLSGCLLPIDRTHPAVVFANHFDKNVIVYVEGTNSNMSVEVPSGRADENVVDACVGTGIRVETEGGEFLGRIDEQACPNWTLTINEDGSLDYVEN